MKLRGALILVVVLCLAAAGFTAYRFMHQPDVVLARAPAGSGAETHIGQFIPADPPHPAPAVSFAADSGGNVDLAQFRGRLVLLNLWATWCAPCVHEMPSLDRLQAKFAGQGLEVVLVSQDRGGAEKVDPFFKKLGLANLKTYLDPKSAVGHGFGVTGLPTSFLIDRDGKVLGRVEGAANWDGENAAALIRSYLAPDEKKAAALK